jgi:hypothetical protein
VIKKLKHSFTIFIVFILILPLCAQPRKLALVIGNGDYQGASLKNPPNDADKFAELLEKLGFNVTTAIDVNREEFEDQIREFLKEVKSKDIILFYFSGHGAQVSGINYLIPIDENIYSEDEIRYKAVSINFILEKFNQAKTGLNIILLDACRTNPFKGFRTTNAGLAFVNAPFGTLISYATSPNSVAYDGSGENSPYMEGLLEVIPQYGLKIEEVFKEVRKRVIEKTNKKQIPWESSSLVGDFYFSSYPVIDRVYSPKFELPSVVKGYLLSRLTAYIQNECPKVEIKQNSFIEIKYEVIDNNIVSEVTPMFIEIVQRKSPTRVVSMLREQFEVNPGKNIIKLAADFELGEYEIEYGFYFKDELNVEYPPFYSRICPLKIIQ